MAAVTWRAVARDINLDEIYLRKSSPALKKLILYKLDAYERVNAHFVDRDAIFSAWTSGDQIVYIKELPGGSNVVYRYNPHRRRLSEAGRFSGVVTYARLSGRGRYVYLKRFVSDRGIIPRPGMVIIDIAAGRVIERKSNFPFLDFSVAAGSDALYYETKRGIVEYHPGGGEGRMMIPRAEYGDIAVSDNPSVGYLSPNLQRALVVNGGGGSYRAKLVRTANPVVIKGITSGSEIHWLDNNRVAYRKGWTGNFSAVLYAINTGKSYPLVRQSFNTNLSYSNNGKNLAILKDQVIMLHDLATGMTTSTGLEGEDLSFDPHGRYFTSLLFKKLFVVGIGTVHNRRIELQRAWKTIAQVYESIRNDSSAFENEYSSEYVKRKIALYRSLLRD